MKDKRKDVKKQPVPELEQEVVEKDYQPSAAIVSALDELLSSATEANGVEYNALLEKLVPLEAGALDMDFALKFFEDHNVSILKDGVRPFSLQK